MPEPIATVRIYREEGSLFYVRVEHEGIEAFTPFRTIGGALDFAWRMLTMWARSLPKEGSPK